MDEGNCEHMSSRRQCFVAVGCYLFPGKQSDLPDASHAAPCPFWTFPKKNKKKRLARIGSRHLQVPRDAQSSRQNKLARWAGKLVVCGISIIAISSALA